MTEPRVKITVKQKRTNTRLPKKWGKAAAANASTIQKIDEEYEERGVL